MCSCISLTYLSLPPAVLQLETSQATFLVLPEVNLAEFLRPNSREYLGMSFGRGLAWGEGRQRLAWPFKETKKILPISL